MSTGRIIVREARGGDFEWVAELMHNALEPFYGGDHRAHARRIFDAHVSGGHDKLGFFSFEQRMFIAEVDDVPAGIIHVVGKRQSTYKISPLVVAPEFQGQYGLGSFLLDHVEKYARDRQARQIYCTVAEKNLAAMQFFQRKGFIRAGSSDSHYKSGITETMLYKPLYEISTITTLDELHVSVVPLDETRQDLKKQVKQLILDRLTTYFEGIDDGWVEALFSGYSRRHTADVNSKYKLIYVALNSTGEVIGVAAATPKKGSPIKVVPFIAINLVAFEALLIDIPHQLLMYGHKLYMHIHPGPDEVIALQRFGWKLDAALPAAYRPEIVTYQWSLNIGETTMRTMRVKKRFYDLINAGTKNLEVRVGYDSINRIKVGERIQLVTHSSSFDIIVKAIRRYERFEDMLKTEPYNRIAPDSVSSAEVLALLKQIYPPNKEALGVVVLEIFKVGK